MTDSSANQLTSADIRTNQVRLKLAMCEELFEAVTALRTINQGTDRMKLTVLAIHMRSLSGQGSAAEFALHATKDFVVLRLFDPWFPCRQLPAGMGTQEILDSKVSCGTHIEAGGHKR